MISAMNTDNLSCTFCFRNMINMLLPATARQGTLLWTKGYPMDKRNVPTTLRSGNLSFLPQYHEYALMQSFVPFHLEYWKVPVQ